MSCLPVSDALICFVIGCSLCKESQLSFNANFSSFSFAESPPRDLQITAYKLIMVCSCAMSSNCVWLQIIFFSCVNETLLFSFLRLFLREKGRSLRFVKMVVKNRLGEGMIKQLLNSVIAKYCDLPVSRTSIICLTLRPRQIVICSPLTNHDILFNLVQLLLIFQ